MPNGVADDPQVPVGPVVELPEDEDDNNNGKDNMPEAYLQIHGKRIDVASLIKSVEGNALQRDGHQMYVDLSGYYTKTEVDTAMASAANAARLDLVVVNELPEASEETMNKIYLVPNGCSGSNVKDEYLTIRSGEEGSYTYAFEKIGTTEVDLTGYVTTAAMNTAISDAIDAIDTLPDHMHFNGEDVTSKYNSSTKSVEINISEVFIDNEIEDDDIQYAYDLDVYQTKVYVSGVRQIMGENKAYTLNENNGTHILAFVSGNEPETGEKIVIDYYFKKREA